MSGSTRDQRGMMVLTATEEVVWKELDWIQIPAWFSLDLFVNR